MIHLEGLACVLPALQARQRGIQVVLLKHDIPASKTEELLAAAAAADVPVRRVDVAELAAMAHGSSHGGVIAVCMPKPRLGPEQLMEHLDTLSGPPLLLMLEGVDDARNLGFTLRSADAIGVSAVLIKKHLWDFDETEVARSSSGAIERVPLVQFDDIDLLQRLQKRSIRVYGCLAEARRTIYDVDLSRGVVLAIGGEKRGLSGAVRQICDQFVTIPTVEGASSLSLSHAGAMVMGEALRQRRAKAQPAENET
ncbi:MAG TPA: RNA methyltransferase [Tepidisphaeraceae bacterium]